MPIEPVEYRILQNLKTNLEKIQAGDEYFNDIRTIEILKTFELEVFETPAIYIVAEGTSENNRPINKQTVFLNVEVHYFLEIYENLTLETRRAVHDLKKAIYSDSEMGALAIDTNITRVYTSVEQEALPYIDVQLFCKIHYRHARFDPSVVC